MADMKYDIDVSELVQARGEVRKWAKTNSDAFSIVNSRMQTMGKTSDIAFNQLGRSATRSQQKLKRFWSVGMQQAGYQVGDFAVQVQGGTNALVAFGQQGSQLAGIFGPMGAVAGALIAIGTAVGNIAFEAIKARSQVQTFEDTLESLRDSLSGLTGVQDILSASTQDLTDKYGQAASAVRAYAEIEAKLQVALARGVMQKSISDLRDLAEKYGQATKVVNDFGESLDISANLRAIQEDFSLVGNEAQRLQRTFATLFKAEGFQAQKDAVDAILSTSKELGVTLDSLPKPVAEVLVNFFEANREIESAEEIIRALEAGVSATADEAKRFADNLADATNNTAQMMTMLRRGFAIDPQEFMRSGQTIVGEVSEPDKPKRSSRGASPKTPKNPREFLEELEREIELKSLLVGVNEEQAERLKLEARLKEELLETGGKITEQDRSRIESLAKQAEAIRKAEAAEERRRNNIERFEQQMSDSITNIVSEAKTIEDAFIGVIRSIVEQMFKQNVAAPIATGFGDFLGNLLPNANGNAFNNGKVTAFADGGVVSKPTMFPMANGAGLMGEAGPEAVMPLKRGKGGKLGVSAEGGSGEAPVTIHQNFNFSANGDESVKRIIASEAPKIASMTQKQILDQRRRGGVVKSTFGG